MTRNLALLACSITILLAAAGSASAAGLPVGSNSRLVAVSTSGQVLTCATNVHNHRFTGSTYYEISGSTTCAGAIQQSCTLTLPNDYEPYTVTLSDSVFDTTCALASGAEGENWGPLTFRTVVHAPAGMVWLGVPTQCTGINTATLDCTFSTGPTPI